MFSSYYPCSVLCIIYAKARLLLAWKIEKGLDSQNYSVYRGQLYEPERSCPKFLPMVGKTACLQSPAIRSHLPGDIADARNRWSHGLPWFPRPAGGLMYRVGYDGREGWELQYRIKPALPQILQGQYPADKRPLKEVRNFTAPSVGNTQQSCQNYRDEKTLGCKQTLRLLSGLLSSRR